MVHLYEQYGATCLEQLQGEFAFLLWDDRQQLLWAARDRFGIKPLYYSEVAGEILFSSEVKGLQHGGLKLAWDEQGFLEQFVFQTCLNGRTLYRGVCELPAGHDLVWKGGVSLVRKYWDISYPLEQDLSAAQSDEFYGEALKDLLESAVRSRMRADVPVACYLSGGIDSTSILGLMTQQATRPVHAFSLSFDDPKSDEFDLAACSAAGFGARHTKVSVTDQSLASNFRQTIWHCENLVANANSVAKFSLSQAVRDAGYRVVLTGEGSDEIFAGYPTFVADTLRYGTETERNELNRTLNVTEKELLHLLYPNGSPSSLTFNSQLGYVPAWMEHVYLTVQQFGNILPESFVASDIAARLLDSLDVRGQLHGRAVLNQSLYIHSKTSLPGVTLSALGDRVEMAHSVEGRLPFLDYRVVNFARSIPCSQKIRKGVEKFVLRQAMRCVIAPEVCGRRKKALIAPPALTDNNSALGSFLQDTLRSRSLESIPFLDKKGTRDVLDQIHLVPPLFAPGLESSLTSIASACVLAEQFAL